MDLTEDGKRGEKEGTPKRRLGKGGASGNVHGRNDMEQCDLDPCGHTSSIGQLVAALH